MPEPDPRAAQKTYSAEQVRQGEIILRTRMQRIIFIAGLAGAAILAVLVALLARHAS